MSKINATYSSGYYLSPDTDYRKLEEAQRAEQRRKRGRPGDVIDPVANTKRQTFAIPFNLICGHCQRHIARGTHVYTNRRPTNTKYLNAIRIWELEMRCRYCQGLFYLHTDPATPKETGGYTCERGCQRGEGDYYALNKQNEAVRSQWEKEKAEAEENPLATLERENEAARQLAERNRQIEEDVIANAEGDDEGLLAALRARNRMMSDAMDGKARGSSGALGDSTLSSSVFSTEDIVLTAEEASREEAEYLRFEAEMLQQWQNRHSGEGTAPAAAEGPATTCDATELAEALRHYGDGNRFATNLADGNVVSGDGYRDSSAARQQGLHTTVLNGPGMIQHGVQRLSRNAFILEEGNEKVADLSPMRKERRGDANDNVKSAQSAMRSTVESRGAAPQSSFLKNLLDDDDSDSSTEDKNN